MKRFLVLGAQGLLSGFELDQLPCGFHPKLTGRAMGEQAQAPPIHHLVDDLDINRRFGLIRFHAQKPNGLALRKARLIGHSVLSLLKAYELLSLKHQQELPSLGPPFVLAPISAARADRVLPSVALLLESGSRRSP